MGELGQAEFKSLEAAVRDRLSTWTGADAHLHFAVLDYPSTLEARLSQQLLEREMNEAVVGEDPGRARLDYLYALDKVVNAVLAGGDTVTPKTETVGKIYGDILKYAQPLPKRLTPAEQAELDRHRAVLYVENPDTGLLDTTPALALYQSLSADVMRKSMEVQQARADHGPDSIEARMKQQALDFAQTDLLVRGQKNRIEEAQARIRVLSTNSGELWQRALLDLEDSLLMDAETTEAFPVSRCPPVPDTNWMQIDLDMRSNSIGAVLGMNEKLLRLQAEIFLVPVDRSGWMQTGVLTQVPWKWGIMGRTGQLSDGKGGGALPYLPEHLVLMRDIKLTVQIPFENGGAQPKAQLPKIGRMAVPLQVRAVDGQRVDGQRLVAPKAMMMAMKPQAAPARAADLRAMRRAQLLRQRSSSRTLMSQMSALQARPALVAAPKAPKVQAVKMMSHKGVFQAAQAAGLRASIGIGGGMATATAKATARPPDLNAAQKSVNDLRAALARAQREKRNLDSKGIIKALIKKQRDAADRKVRDLTAKLQRAERHLQSERARAQRIAEAARQAAEEAKARADEERRKREAEQKRRAEQEARRRAPSPVALAVHAFAKEAWVPRPSKLSVRDSRGRITNAQTDAAGVARLELAPGTYTAQVSLLEIDETSERITFECAMGEPVSQVMTVLPKWQTVELTACEPGGEVLLLGYLLRSLPALPQVVDAAAVDTDVPDLVG